MVKEKASTKQDREAKVQELGFVLISRTDDVSKKYPIGSLRMSRLLGGWVR